MIFYKLSTHLLIAFKKDIQDVCVEGKCRLIKNSKQEKTAFFFLPIKGNSHTGLIRLIIPFENFISR